jgi:alpha-amylase
MAAHPAIGRIYVPTASYVEMTQWALPVDEANVFAQLLEEATAAGSPAMRFLRGGMWRNFQARYREIGELHKQMLRASAAVDAMPAGPAKTDALDHLFRGQSNDCFWHGWFGGIYIVHMRMATLAELIAAEDLALGKRALSGTADYDLDGVDEVAVGTIGQTVVVDPAEGGGISSWDLRASRFALASVLKRRPEAYHEKLREAEAVAAGVRDDDQSLSADTLMVKEVGLSKLLVYDRDERRSGLVRVKVRGKEVGDWPRGSWEVTSAKQSEVVLTRSERGLSVVKTITLGGTRNAPILTVGLEATAGAQAVAGELALEWNLNLQGGGGNPQAYYRWDKKEARHDAPGRLAADGPTLSFGNTYSGIDIGVTAEPAAARDWYPVQTVSNSEGGFERVYQGSCLTFRWPLALAAGGHASFRVAFAVKS